MRLKKSMSNMTTDSWLFLTRVSAMSASSRSKKRRRLTRSVRKSLVARSSSLRFSRAIGSITSEDSDRFSTTNSKTKLPTRAVMTVLKVWRAFSSGKYMGTFTT